MNELPFLGRPAKTIRSVIGYSNAFGGCISSVCGGHHVSLEFLGE